MPDLGFTATTSNDYYFLSYNTEDAHRVRPIAVELDRGGLPMWYDYDIKYGEDWRHKISKKIKYCRAIILFITAGMFLKEDSFVHREYLIAQNYKIKIFPVFLDHINSLTVPSKYADFWIDLQKPQGAPLMENEAPADTAARILKGLGGAISKQVETNGSSTSASRMETSTETISGAVLDALRTRNPFGALRKNDGRTITLGKHTFAVNARRIDVKKCGISDISPLAELHDLTVLNLDGNNITDITPLENLTKLTTLNLSNNGISDITTLVGLTNLTWLFLSNNRISDTRALYTLTNLRNLYLNGNPIAEDDRDKLRETLPNCSIAF